jgi:hypothetical protein
MRYRQLRCRGAISFRTTGSVHCIRDTSRDSTAFPGELSEYVHRLACSPEPVLRADLDLADILATDLRTIGATAPDRIAVCREATRSSALHVPARRPRHRGVRNAPTAHHGPCRGHPRQRRDRTRPAPPTSSRSADIIPQDPCTNPEPADRYTYGFLRCAPFRRAPGELLLLPAVPPGRPPSSVNL